MAVNIIGNDIRPIRVDTLGIGVTPVYGARSLRDLYGSQYTFGTGLIEVSNHVQLDTSYYLFDSDIDVILADGKSLGKYLNGDTIPAVGKTAVEVIRDIATEYLDASFTAFSVSGVTIVEVGTTLSGNRTFTWTIDEGSGDVNFVNIHDTTDGSNLELEVANDGSHVLTINTLQLNTYGATQQWRMTGVDSTPSPNVIFNSNFHTVTARYYRYYGPTSSAVALEADVIGLPESDFHITGASFDLNTGTTESRFAVALPPGRTITSVIDETALFATITSAYILTGTIDVADAGGTTRTYNIYEMTLGGPYSEPHIHAITTA